LGEYQSEEDFVANVNQALGYTAGVYGRSLPPWTDYYSYAGAVDTWGYGTRFKGPTFINSTLEGEAYVWDCDDDSLQLFADLVLTGDAANVDVWSRCQAPLYVWGSGYMDYGDGPYSVQPMYTAITVCLGDDDDDDGSGWFDFSSAWDEVGCNDNYYRLYGPLTGDFLEDPLFSNYEQLHDISTIQVKMDSNEEKLIGETFAPVAVSTLTDPVEIFKSYAIVTQQESEEKTFTPIPKKIKSSLQLTFSGLEGEKASTENLVVSTTSGRT